MPYITTRQSSEKPVEIHYHDHGQGQPIVLIHGWPLSERSWEKQEPALLEQGFRVIKYDRRGFGESSKPIEGYNYDTLAGDLNELMTELDLKQAILVGFSMGAGEVARYLGKYGSERVEKAVFIGGITPFLLKTDDNQQGVDEKVFIDIQENIKKDRLAFLEGFFNDFYSSNVIESKTGMTDVSGSVLKFSFQIAAMASPIATLQCVSAWLEDFRSDLSRIKVPCLVIHGDSDRIVPLAASGKRVPDFVEDCKYVEIKGGPHGILMSHPDEVNEALSEFIGTPHAVFAKTAQVGEQFIQ